MTSYMYDDRMTPEAEPMTSYEQAIAMTSVRSMYSAPEVPDDGAHELDALFQSVHSTPGRSGSRSPVPSEHGYDVWARASSSGSVDRGDYADVKHSRRRGSDSKEKDDRNTCVKVLSKTVKVTVQLLLISLVVAGYTIAGGVLFWYLEGPIYFSLQDQQAVEYKRGNLTERLAELYNDFGWVNIGANETCGQVCRSNISSIIREYDSDADVDPAHYNKFQIEEATFYAMTLYTTIGYGTVYPFTDEGKIATIIYAMVGIPLIMVILGKLGAMIEDGLSGIVNLVRRFVKCGKEGEASVVPTLITLLAVAAYVAASCYMVQTHSDLNSLDAVYFTFISFTTIGLGDVMPDESFNLYSTAIFLVGLALLASVIASLSAFFMKWYEKSQAQMNDMTRNMNLTSAQEMMRNATQSAKQTASAIGRTLN